MSRIPIGWRVPLFMALAIAAIGGALAAWNHQAQREAHVAQARAFAESVHQLTLAGLTALMITGSTARREVFLDQIRHSRDVRSLRVVRSPAVARQFGPGRGTEQPVDDLEREALDGGRATYEVRDDATGHFLRAVVPAVASRDSLGKDCLGCHRVAEGTVLGAVSMEISLDRGEAALAARRDRSLALGLAALLALVALARLALVRSVSAPLVALARRLDALAQGRVDRSRLVATGHDEIARVVGAFDRVLARAQSMLRDERIALDVFDHALEGICVTDAQGTIVRVNPAFTRTTGYEPSEAIGRNPRLLQSGRHDAEFYRRFWGELATRGQWQGDIWNRRKSGEVYPEFLTISRVCDEAGAVQNYVAVFSDITERKREEARIRHQAQHDALTGLPNRALFRDRLEQALGLARRRGHPLAVMFVDLDRFKAVNDLHGHEVGDALLREVADRLRACVRASDTVARLGGDEFTVLLPEIASVDDALVVGDKVLEATSVDYELLGHRVAVTSSVGMSLYPRHGEDADTLLAHADRAMYRIKGAGRAGLHLFDGALG